MDGQSEVPGWITKVIGLFLLWVAFVCTVGSIYIIFSPFIGPNMQMKIGPVAVVLIGTFLFIASAFGMIVSWRMVMGRRAEGGGLLSPRSLRVVGTIYAALMVLALVLSIINSQFDPSEHWFNIAAIISVIVGLFGLARKREAAR